jgi:hypothetical protein
VNIEKRRQGCTCREGTHSLLTKIFCWPSSKMHDTLRRLHCSHGFLPEHRIFCCRQRTHLGQFSTGRGSFCSTRALTRWLHASARGSASPRRSSYQRPRDVHFGEEALMSEVVAILGPEPRMRVWSNLLFNVVACRSPFYIPIKG